MLYIPTDQVLQTTFDPISSIPLFSQIADWVTLIALPLTILGLILTYLQSKKTKSAADAAKASAVSTAEKMESFQFTANLAMNVEKLKTCHILLKESKWDEVVRHLTEARDQLIIVRESLNQNSTDSAIQDELSMLKYLKNSMNHCIRELHSKSYNEEYQLTIDTIYDNINSVHEFFVAKQKQINRGINHAY